MSEPISITEQRKEIAMAEEAVKVAREAHAAALQVYRDVASGATPGDLEFEKQAVAAAVDSKKAAEAILVAAH